MSALDSPASVAKASGGGRCPCPCTWGRGDLGGVWRLLSWCFLNTWGCYSPHQAPGVSGTALESSVPPLVPIPVPVLIPSCPGVSLAFTVRFTTGRTILLGNYRCASNLATLGSHLLPLKGGKVAAAFPLLVMVCSSASFSPVFLLLLPLFWSDV